MRFIFILIYFLAFSLTVKANHFTNKDSVATNKGDVLTKTTSKSKVQKINRLDAFIDSINTTIPDSMPYYDWITDDIHQRKFDFSKIEDTLMVILNDCGLRGCYRPIIVG